MSANNLGKEKATKPPPRPGDGHGSSQIVVRMNYGSKKIRKQQKESVMKPPVADKVAHRRRRNSFGGLPSTVDQCSVQLPLTQQEGCSGMFSTSNQFALLSDDDDEDINNGDGGASATAQWARECTSGDANSNGVKSSVSKVRCPPIFVYGSSVPTLNRIISTTTVAKSDYHLRVRKNNIQIKVKTKPHFTEIVNTLEASRTQFYTHGTSDQVPVKIVLSGLPVFPVEEVTQELAAVNVRPASVRQLATSKHGDYALYLLQFSNGAVKLQDLQKVTSLFNVIVWWRYYSKKKADVVQCFRCQQYGHGMRNCHLEAKCVKCGERHQTSECTLPGRSASAVSEDRSLIRCANCSQNHTASFKGCPMRLKYLQELKAKKRTRPVLGNNRAKVSTVPVSAPRGASGDISQLLGSITNPNVSYSQIVQGNSQPGSPNLFTVEEFMCLARELFHSLSNCQSKAMQFLALSELIIKYVYNGHP